MNWSSFALASRSIRAFRMFCVLELPLRPYAIASFPPGMASFAEETFTSFDEFSHKFSQFKDENFVAFRTKSSEKVGTANAKTIKQIDPKFCYSRVHYVCTHFGQPRYRGTGIKSKTKHSATGCEASFVLQYDYCDRVLRLTKVNMIHNHPTTPETYAQEHQVKRLGRHEKQALREIVELNPRNENLLAMVNSKFGKSYTLAEIRRLKHQLTSGSGNNMVELMDSFEDLQDNGQVKMVISNNGKDNLLDLVAFSTTSMQQLFHKYPEVIFMDGTYKCNKSGYPLYQIMVEDGCGRGRAIFYAFVRQENAQLLARMVEVFKEFMGEATHKIQFAMTDKDVNEINAIKSHLPNVQTMLCAFHVHKAMKAKIHKMQCPKQVRDRLLQLAHVLVTTNDIATFNKQLCTIQSLNVSFYDYLLTNWLTCTETWAYYARLNSRLFFNDTNNKCEGENRRLKEILNTNTSMPMAMRKLYHHSVMAESDLSAACFTDNIFCCIHYRDANPRWNSLYSLFSSHAVLFMIQEQASCPVPFVSIDDAFDCVVYRVSGRPLTCSCPFYVQTELPCSHMMSIFCESIEVSLSDLYSPRHKWLKANISGHVRVPQVAPVAVHPVVGPEARHHRTEAVLARLSCLLKASGSLQFLERVGKIESVVEAWEGGIDCVILPVQIGQELHIDGVGEWVNGDERGGDGDDAIGEQRICGHDSEMNEEGEGEGEDSEHWESAVGQRRDESAVGQRREESAVGQRRALLVRGGWRALLVRGGRRALLVRGGRRALLVRGGRRALLVRGGWRALLVRGGWRALLVRGERRALLVRGGREMMLRGIKRPVL